MLENLHENLVLNWTYHSNAIEGNTLTLKETKVALEGITVGGKTLREHFEAINHREAILFLEEQVQAKAPINEWLIKSLHQLVLKNIDNDNAGKYRTINVLISGAEHTPSEAMQVPEQMQQFIDWANNDALQLHPIEAAARIHGELVKIHPFTDGNGRTPRLLMNLVLMQAGFPATIITVEQRLEYYSALDQAHTTGNYQCLCKFSASNGPIKILKICIYIFMPSMHLLMHSHALFALNCALKYFYAPFHCTICEITQ